MQDNSAKIAQLRASLALTVPEKYARVPLGFAPADRVLKGGILCGALHEVFSEGGHEIAASGFAAALAARVSGKKHLLWIRQDFSALEHGEISATGLLELGIDPARVLVLRVHDATSALRAANDALSCAALGAMIMEVIGETTALDLVASRRLGLAAAEHGVTAFLLRFAAEPDASAAETRWLVRAARSKENDENWGTPRFETKLLRNRHGNTGEWVMEWNCDTFSFRAADLGAVVSAPSDRPAATANERQIA